jgi:hypothetical protein
VLVVFDDARSIRTLAVRCRSAAFGLQGIRKRFVRGEVHGRLGKNHRRDGEGCARYADKFANANFFSKKIATVLACIAVTPACGRKSR